MLALAIAATIAGYTLVDERGIEHASAIAYLELVLLPVAARSRRSGTSGHGQPWTGCGRDRRERRRRHLLFAAYALALGALSLAPAAAVAAVRETGILFAVALGSRRLREPVGPCRTWEPGSSSPGSRSWPDLTPSRTAAILRAPHFTGFTKWARSAHSF